MKITKTTYAVAFAITIGLIIVLPLWAIWTLAGALALFLIVDGCVLLIKKSKQRRP